MAGRLPGLTLTWLMAVFTLVAPPVSGIQVSCSSGYNGAFVSSTESFDLDASTSLHEQLDLNLGSIYQNRQASGAGKNSLTQSISGNGYSLQNDIASEGAFGVSTSSAATAQAASLSQDVSGAGSMSLSLQGEQAGSSAGQEASVAFGTLASSQSLSAGAGQGALAGQSTQIEGQGGKVVSGALGEENVMLAEGGFSGQGSMKAVLASAASERAFSSGSAAIDDVVILDDESFKAVSPDGGNKIMGMSGLRMMGDGSGIGSFGVSILNLDLTDKKGAAMVSKTAAAASGGSYSSYKLTGYRLNTKNPKLQLYLNPTNTPSGLTAASSQSAIAAAANTWDGAVAGNIFADGTTVKVDSKKVVDNPFTNTPKRDGYNVHGWKKFGNSYIGLNRWWSNGVKVGGYYSIIESDTWYNLDYQWTTSLATATSTRKLDLQSVALHELGHCIGMGDIYSSIYGGILPPSDPRTKDFQQVMNLYDGPQRTLGNGDRTGAQILYGKV